jgi:hypothetical protein
VPVHVHDFADPRLGKAIPYGIYDLAANTGWFNVGTDHDNPTFAVECIRRWWHDQGQADCPRSRQLTVCHLPPPGTSKWNKIEHRLFPHITTRVSILSDHASRSGRTTLPARTARSLCPRRR